MIKENKEFSSSNLLIYLFKWRKLIILITISGTILSTIASFLITPKYKSSVVFFPANINSISNSILSNLSATKDFLQYGDEEVAEQFLQLLNSEYIKNRICTKYNLLEHYEIDPDSKYKQTLLYKKYDENVNFKRTKFGSIRIEVLDKDPKMAANIANDISNLLDSVKNKMQQKMAKDALKIVEEEFNKKQKYVSQLQDSLSKLGKMGAFDYKSQSEVLTEQLAIAINKNNNKAIKEIQKRLDILSKYGSTAMFLSNYLEFESEKLSVLRMKYEQIKVDAEKILENKFVVNKAYPAEKKSYPIRWLIVVVSTISSFLFSIVLIIIFQKIKELRQYIKE